MRNILQTVLSGQTDRLTKKNTDIYIDRQTDIKTDIQTEWDSSIDKKNASGLTVK